MRYTTPIICDRNSDLEKEWYVEFYFEGKRYCVKSGKKYGIPGKPKLLLNRKKRKIYFQKLQGAIHKRLQEGWNPTGRPDIDTISDAILFALTQKADTSTANYSDYQVRSNKFLAYLKQQQLQNLKPPLLSKKHVKNFLSEFKAKNHNNYLKILKALFQVLVTEEILHLNPASGIQKKKVVTGQHETYPPDLAKEIIQFTAIHYPQLHLIILLEYYCFLRPSEIRRLKNKDIDLEKGTITVRALDSKTGRLRTLPIHQDLKAVLEAHKSNEEFLLQQRNKNALNSQFKRLRKRLEIPRGYTLYSFKHTGVCALYLATKDIYLVSRLCGHTSIQTTQIYLRSLGQDVGYLSTEGLPSIL